MVFILTSKIECKECDGNCYRVRQLLTDMKSSKCYSESDNFMQCDCIACLSLWLNLCTLHRTQYWSKNNGYVLERKQIEGFVKDEIINPLVEVLIQ